MSELDDSLDGPDNFLIKELSKTPEVTLFSGTDRYRVCRCLGEGGFGVVYEVEDRRLGRRLALKTLKSERGGLAVRARLLKSEFRSVADLVHPNLVGLHELSSADGRLFFTMELVSGCDFLEYVCGRAAEAFDKTLLESRALPAPRRDTSGVLSETRLRAALRQLVSGVSALHRAGIVHRDLKPTNVLVDSDGRVVVLDFGLAGGELAGDSLIDVTGAGTPVYMAPEQAHGSEVTGAADWYAVGVMLYEALTGTVPFSDRSPFGIVQQKWTLDPVKPSEHARVPADLERLCLALLQRDPGERPDAAEILEALGEATPARRRDRRRTEQAMFVGRGRELDALRSSFEAMRRGQARLVRIPGDPGIGKSALLGRFLDQLSEQGDVALLAGRCYERESVPYKAFDGVADALARYLRRLPRNEASALMPRDIHLLIQLFPVLEEVPAVRDVPRRQCALPDPRESRSRAFAAFKELIARIADKQPLVIAVDDLWRLTAAGRPLPPSSTRSWETPSSTAGPTWPPGRRIWPRRRAPTAITSPTSAGGPPSSCSRSATSTAVTGPFTRRSARSGRPCPRPCAGRGFR